MNSINSVPPQTDGGFHIKLIGNRLHTYLFIALVGVVCGVSADGDANPYLAKQGEPVKNADLWRALEAEAARRKVNWSPAREAPDELSDGLDQRAAQAARGEA